MPIGVQDIFDPVLAVDEALLVEIPDLEPGSSSRPQGRIRDTEPFLERSESVEFIGIDDAFESVWDRCHV